MNAQQRDVVQHGNKTGESPAAHYCTSKIDQMEMTLSCGQRGNTPRVKTEAGPGEEPELKISKDLLRQSSQLDSTQLYL